MEKAGESRAVRTTDENGTSRDMIDRLVRWLTDDSNPLTGVWGVTAIAAAAYSLLLFYVRGLLGFKQLTGDTLWYWNDSLSWWQPFNTFHVPLYPWAIAVARGLTGGVLPPIWVMHLVTAVATWLSVNLVYRITAISGLSRPTSAATTLFFYFWPVIGLAFAVHPRADAFAIAVLLAALLALMRDRSALGGVLCGAALITHKALWPFVLAIWVAWWMGLSIRRSWRTAIGIAAAAAPLTALWIAGAQFHGSYGWLLGTNIEWEISTESGFHPFHGVTYTLQSALAHGTINTNLLLKWLTVTATILSSATLAVLAFWRKGVWWRYSLALCLPVVALGAILNPWEIFATVRFGRFLAPPLIWQLSSSAYVASWPQNRKVVVVLICLTLSLISQFVMAEISVEKMSYPIPQP